LPIINKEESIAQQLSPEELASFKELPISDMTENQAIAELLIEKGIRDKKTIANRISVSIHNGGPPFSAGFQ
jgi:hypothetical protein